jgi:hypothetical protein
MKIITIGNISTYTESKKTAKKMMNSAMPWRVSLFIFSPRLSVGPQRRRPWLGTIAPERSTSAANLHRTLQPLVIPFLTRAFLFPPLG